jgi:glycosyltransferase involved in cell wall biosynthesis
MAQLRFWDRLVAASRVDTVVLAKCEFDVRWPLLDLAMSRRGPRFVHIEQSFPPDLNALKPRKRLGLIPGVGLWYWRHRGILALHRAASDRVIAVSHAIRERLVTDYGYRIDAVSVVHNGIDTTRFRPDRDARARARSRWRIPDPAFVVGTVSRLAPVKRLERLLAAFRLLPERMPEPCYLVIVGDGPAEAALRSEAERSGIGTRCVWAGASASPWEDYPGFDCFAMTSEREGLPHTLLEAMACECLPVAMLVPGLPEVVADGSTGRLVDQDPAALGAALQEVRAYDPTRRREIGMRARRHVLLHHEAHRQVEASCDVILGSGAGPAA